jgi:MFS family permease
VFAALLLPAGAIGDRHGRKPPLVIGLAVFGAVSLVALRRFAGRADRDSRGNGLAAASTAVALIDDLPPGVESHPA